MSENKVLTAEKYKWNLEQVARLHPGDSSAERARLTNDRDSLRALALEAVEESEKTLTAVEQFAEAACKNTKFHLTERKRLAEIRKLLEGEK